jgi:inorganic phosphate transporter, PiT family
MKDFAVAAIIVFALVFDFTNGFHDAANSIATVVSTRVLTPRVAVIWAAFFNFMAFFVFHTHVANTIAKGVVDQDVLTIGVVFSGLVGAIVWNLLTFWFGLPTSSSHALVGGMAGAAVARHGFSSLLWAGINKILIFIVLSPLIGLALGWCGMIVLLWVTSRFHNVRRLNLIFRRTQLLSSAAFSLGHGANDAQKTMGIILALLIASGHASKHAAVPLWVVLLCYASIAAGTMVGGLRIVRTMGSRITRLQPIGGTVAETSAAVTLFYTSAAGIPVSTTHAIAGSIAGVGSAKRSTAVNWKVAGNVVRAWVLTLPGAFIPAAVCSLVIAGVS